MHSVSQNVGYKYCNSETIYTGTRTLSCTYIEAYILNYCQYIVFKLTILYMHDMVACALRLHEFVWKFMHRSELIEKLLCKINTCLTTHISCDISY
jgi:hypothetical protein